MNDEQIVEYARNMIMTNLKQYAENNKTCLAEALKIEDDNERLLYHINGVIPLLEKAKEILEKEK